MWGGKGGVCVSWTGENDRCERTQDIFPWYTGLSMLASRQLASILTPR